MKKLKKYMIVLFIGFLAFSLIKNVFDYRKRVSFYEEFKKDYETEKKNNIALKTKILKNTDSYEIEKTIRDDLNLSKKDEVVVIVPEPTPQPTKAVPTAAPVYKQWLHAFFQN